MATKRRSKEQIQVDKIIKKELLKFGDLVLETSVPASRRDTGRLQDEQNFRVEKDTQLVFTQMAYGAYNYPEGKNAGEKNALLIEIKKQIPKSTKVIVRDIIATFVKPLKNK